MDKTVQKNILWSLCCCCCRSRKISGIKSDTNTTLETDISFPELAYVGDLPNPLLTGHLVTVIGTTLPQCSRFSINFKCGRSESADIAFHFNPRLEENYIVRNSYLNGRWGTEETTSFDRLNLKYAPFKFSFFMAPQHFMVSIHDKHFCEFKFRVPLTKVTSLTVVGDVSIEMVKTTDASEYPKDSDLLYPEISLAKPLADEQLPNPFIGRVTPALEPGWQVEIMGRIKLLPHSFSINLQEGAQIWPHPQIPLHLNPRFYGDKNHVVRNTWSNGVWGQEERTGSQFYPGCKFHLIIRYENDEFSVWVDNKMTGIFKARSKNTINTIVIQGDLIINRVWINTTVQNIFIDIRPLDSIENDIP